MLENDKVIEDLKKEIKRKNMQMAELRKENQQLKSDTCKILNFFLKNNHEIENGGTILHHVIPCSDELLKVLIDFSIDINIVNKNGWTPLMVACSNPSAISNALTLLNAGADFNASTQPIWNVACDEVLQAFRENGITISSVDSIPNEPVQEILEDSKPPINPTAPINIEVCWQFSLI